MIVKIGGTVIETAAPVNPAPGPQEPLFPALHQTSPGDVAFQWILEKLGDMFHDLGMFLLHISPDALIIFGMVGCLGVIMNIKHSGKFTVGSLIASIMMEVVRMEVGA